MKKTRASLFLIGVFLFGSLAHLAIPASPDPLRGKSEKILFCAQAHQLCRRLYRTYDEDMCRQLSRIGIECRIAVDGILCPS